MHALSRQHDTDLDVVLGLRPDISARFAAYYNATLAHPSLPPTIVELSRLRIAQILGAEFELTCRSGSVSDDKVTALPAWPLDPQFSAAERTCLHWVEQFVLDSSGLADDDCVAVRGVLGDQGFVAFDLAIGLMESVQRFGLAMGVASHRGPELRSPDVV